MSLQFLDLMMSILPDRAANNWKTFKYYLELIHAFAVHGPEELEGNIDTAIWNKGSEAY